MQMTASITAQLSEGLHPVVLFINWNDRKAAQDVRRLSPA